MYQLQRARPTGTVAALIGLADSLARNDDNYWLGKIMSSIQAVSDPSDEDSSFE